MRESLPKQSTRIDDCKLVKYMQVNIKPIYLYEQIHPKHINDVRLSLQHCPLKTFGHDAFSVEQWLDFGATLRHKEYMSFIDFPGPVWSKTR